MQQTIFYLLDVVVFAAVVFAALAITRRVEAGISVRRRLRGDEAPAARAARPKSPLMKTQELHNPVLQWVQNTTLQDPAARTQLRRDLAMAGLSMASAPALYVVGRFLLAVGLPAAFFVMEATSAKPIRGFWYIVIMVGLAILGLIVPRGILDNRINARKTRLANEFPDVLDLMVVCVESGLGLEAALVRVGNETQKSHPLISQEFQMITFELQAGRTRAEALRNMADRTQVETISSFVALLVQTDALGGSIASTLRTYSAEMRQHRMLKAEEKAMRLPVLITVPLVLFILPTIMVAVLLPPVLDGIRTLMPTLRGAG
ncbi:MAG: type II secretion system F family protein [Caulobacteraceae bacterium]